MHLFWTITATLLIVTISYAETKVKKNTAENDGREKRNIDYTVTHNPTGGSSFRLERRSSSSRPIIPQAQRRVSSQYGNQRTYNSVARRHRPNTIPPYAVQMEPLVQYSQRDPLFDGQKPIRKDIENHFVNDNKISAKSDNFVSETHFSHPQFYPPPPLPPPQQYGPPAQHHHEPPEPIIEIIIKESNISLPPPPTLPPIPRKKEPVQVFYVKYKKDPYGGKDAVIYDAPIPAVTPASNIHNEHEEQQNVEQHQPDSYEPQEHQPPPPSTTLRTIIKPDSEVYHTDSNVHVTFGTEDKYHHEKSDTEKHEESAPQPSLVFPNTPNIKNHQPVFPQAQASSQVQKRQPATNQQSQFSGNSFQGDFSSTFNNQPYYRPFPPSQYSTIQLGPAPGPSFPRAQGPFHTQSFPPNQKYFPRPSFSNFNKQPQPPFLNSPTNSPFYQGLPHVQQRQPFNQAQPQPSQASFSSLQYTPQKTEPPQVYKTIRVEETLPRQQSYQTIKQNVPSKPNQETRHEQTINLHLNHNLNRNPAPTSNPSIQHQQNSHYQNQEQQPQRPQFTQHPQQNQQSFQYYNQNVNKIPTDNGLSSPNFNFYNQQERNKNQHQQSNPPPFIQSNQQGPSQIPQQQGHVLPPGGELFKSIPKFEQHLSIAVPTTQTTAFNHPTFPKTISETTFHEAPNHNYNTPSPQTTNQLQFPHQNQHQHQTQNNNQHLNQKQNVNQHQNQNQNVNQHQRGGEDTIQYFKSTELSPSQNYRPNFDSNDSPRQPTYTSSQSDDSQSKTNEKTYLQREQPKTQEEKSTTTEQPIVNFNLPDEVPDELRQQLLSSGILNNADISVLDYDKIGDIPIEALPPDQLANFYGAAKEQGVSASEPIRSVVTTNGEKVPDLSSIDQDYETSASEPIQSVVTINGDSISDRSSLDQDFASSDISEALASSHAISMKVVHYDHKSQDDESIPAKYVQENATELSPVVLNDKKYTRYLPLKVSGAQFPIPDVDELRGKDITSVVVLAPIDYDFSTSSNDHGDRIEREVQTDSRVNVSVALQELIKNPTTDNFNSWLESEGQISNDKQAVVLLVTGDETTKEIFMYDILTKSVSRLNGELSTAFVEAAESNVQSSPELNQNMDNSMTKDVPNAFGMDETISNDEDSSKTNGHRSNTYL